MTNTLPTGEELEGIDQVLELFGAKGPTARALAIKAFSNGEYTAETINAWMALQLVDNRKMFPTANGSDSGGHAANSAAAANGADHNADNTAEKNPWMLPANDPVGIARRTEVIKSLGTRVAAGLAKAANVDLAARPLKVA